MIKLILMEENMRLFHVSQKNNIEVFKPRILERRPELDQGNGFVWAVTLEKLYGFFFPEDCPRLLTFKGKEPNYVEGDYYAYAFIEEKHLEELINCSVTIYEFKADNFILQDDIAGYYVSEVTERPIAKYQIVNCMDALECFDVKLFSVQSLEKYKNEIMSCTNNYSFRKLKKDS